ncbi:DUF6708 domain-containing protein [Iodobacter fluviatilis]|uniref:DUF6708 domain-containing protein n=1 Tax=Iodobacter fluviatilis TaxID=537 RepID=A0A377Q9L8_9NEIS|nr:DUF6708 domain-containing protein [Iodobacter fluviatilis]TCU81885.1 hypothetical protein EV682_1186 [Iodobacter fluviatilis]STQ91582.1 Uncharacterised protein [Iodobacter fluviatilis]
MNYLGLLGKYPNNRALTTIEVERKLGAKKKLGLEPAHQLSAIKINSNFIELVDKYFIWKGVITTFTSIAIFFGIAILGAIGYDFFINSRKLSDEISTIFFVCLMVIPFVGFFVHQLSRESFAYTHYPIRLNRKTRMVHVFRINGTVLSVPWDEVFFCIAPCGKGDWEIQGHVLDKEKKTVLETFAFSEGAGSKLESEKLKHYWEFVRRYMEEGPESVIDGITGYLPISDRRETFIFGFHRMRFTVGAAPLILQIPILVLNTLIYPARWFAMRTSKIPVWPKEIEDQCPVEENDPYARDYRNNPA